MIERQTDMTADGDKDRFRGTKSYPDLNYYRETETERHRETERDRDRETKRDRQTEGGEGRERKRERVR